MKIVGIKYIAPVMDNSGYAKASRQNILALNSLGVPVTVQSISFEQARPDLGEDGKILQSLIDKKINYNIVIMHCTPEFYKKFREPDKENIGYTIWETTKLHPDWIGYINDNVSALFVGCEWNVDVFKDSGITVPIFNAPHCISLKSLEHATNFDVAGVKKDTFMFYYVAQWVERKSPLDLVKAYWSAFPNGEDVALVLKTYRSDYSETEKDAIRQTLRRLKAVCAADNFPPVHLILDMLSEDEINGLHKRGDCYASLDRGEGFGLCVGKKTKISIPSGIKYAEDIKIGDEVLSVDGKFHEVRAVSSKYVESSLVLSTALHEDIIVSDSHPFLVGKNITRHVRYTYTPDKIESLLEWKESKHIAPGDYVAVPKPIINESIDSIDISDVIINKNMIIEDETLYLKNGYSPKDNKHSYKNLAKLYGYSKKIFESAVVHIKNNTTPLINSYTYKAFHILKTINYRIKVPNKVKRYINMNEDVLSLFGWYLAEGSTNNDAFLEIDLHRKEYNVAVYLSDVFKKEFGVENKSILIEKYDNKSRLIVSSKVIALLFSTLFGKGANNKHMPGWLFMKGSNLLPMVRSLFAGDGHDSGSTYRLTTTSNSLAYQVKLLLNSFGYCPRISRRNKSKLGNYPIYTVSIANNDYLSFIGKPIINKELKHFIETDNYFLVKVINVKETMYNDYMFDFSVEDGKSFVGNGLLLHNCPFQAGAVGNPIIVTGFGGVTEYAKPDNSYLVDYIEMPVFGMPWSPWYKLEQNWAQASVSHGSKLMKHVFNNRDEAKQRGKLLQESIKTNFTWEKLGNRMIDAIKSL